MNEALRLLLDRGEPTDQAALERLMFADNVVPVTDITVAQVDLTEFDSLFLVRGVAMISVVDFRQTLTEGLIDLHLPTVRHCYEETARRAEQETAAFSP